MATIKAQPDDTTLLVFDGQVLEMFGRVDAHRIHVWQQPVLELRDGKRPQARIRCEIGTEYTFPFDTHRRAELEALAAALADADGTGSTGSTDVD
ncbi:hypothetical protein KVF89_07310 [Nocardioides carbamazepini]|uniref:hypothetical protein n=1 Tax=Nocardioides carbamazepini TaxID=2854259 RepID=UPI002149AFDC|nr:hypothetical protein [Nocardioides carbamazepini]MCR1782335.1 hypothetical protein [Nocardioides carbamazepini]